MAGITYPWTAFASSSPILAAGFCFQFLSAFLHRGFSSGVNTLDGVRFCGSIIAVNPFRFLTWKLGVSRHCHNPSWQRWLTLGISGGAQRLPLYAVVRRQLPYRNARHDLLSHRHLPPRSVEHYTAARDEASQNSESVMVGRCTCSG